METEGSSSVDNSAMLHDVVNKLITNVFESDAAREHLRDAFPSSAAATNDDAAKRVLSNFTAAVLHNLNASVDTWIADNKLATHLAAVKTKSCFQAALASDENSASVVNAPQTSRPAQSIAQVTETFKRQHLDQLSSALADREGRLEELRSELRQQIDEASALCKKLDAISASAAAPMRQ